MVAEAQEPELNADDLISEKSLYQIWRKCRKLPASKFNTWVTILVAIITISMAFFSQQTRGEIAEAVRTLCDIGLNFASAMLGFLLAGFTIFATVTDIELLKSMARMREDNTRLSYIKYTFFPLIEVFILYLWFVALCLAIKVSAAPKGAVGRLLHSISFGKYDTGDWLARIAFVIIIIAFTCIILKLKSFVYNIFHVVFFRVAAAMDEEDSDSEGDDVAPASE